MCVCVCVCVCVHSLTVCEQWQEVYDKGKGKALYTSHLTQISHDNVLSRRLMDHLSSDLILSGVHLSLFEEALKYSIQLLEVYLCK